MNIQRNIIICIVLFLFLSCGSLDKSKNTMQTLNIKIVTNCEIVGDAKMLLPDRIKKFLYPIECEKKVFIPNVCVSRVDIQDSAYCIIVPKETANSIRESFGTYDYENLQEDYAEYIPKMQSGEYLSKKSDGSHKDFIFSTEDLVFYHSKEKNKAHPNSYNNIDSILILIKDYLCDNEIEGNKNIIIVLDGFIEKKNPLKIIFNNTISSDNIPPPSPPKPITDCNSKTESYNEIAAQYGQAPAANNNRERFFKILSSDASILVDDKIYTDKSELVNLFHKNRETGYTLKSNETKLDTDCKIKCIVFISKK